MSYDFPTSIGRLGLVAFDCPDALALAGFYSSIIGGDLVPGDDEGWVELHTPDRQARLPGDRRPSPADVAGRGRAAAGATSTST